MFGPSKDDLRQEVSQVTMDIQKIQNKIKELRTLLTELEEMYRDADRFCFPFKYFMLKDLVHDAYDAATGLSNTWYGATNDPGDDRKKARGGVRRLLENCKEMARRMNQYERIMEEVGGLSKKALEQAIEERKAALAQHKLVFAQLQNLLQQLQDLHVQSRDLWFWPRYVMLKRVVSSCLGSFRSVAGLSDLSALPKSQAVTRGGGGGGGGGNAETSISTSSSQPPRGGRTNNRI